MTRIDIHYAVLALAAATALLANWFPGQVAAVEPGLSLIGVVAVVGVVWSIFAAELKTSDPVARRHLAGQKAVVLAWIVTDVLSVFQWLLHFKRLWLGVSVNDALALLTLLSWGGATLLLGHLILKRVGETRAGPPATAPGPDAGDGTGPTAHVD
jgi:hypothetical protein